jgi:hypothetical protein
MANSTMNTAEQVRAVAAQNAVDLQPYGMSYAALADTIEDLFSQEANRLEPGGRRVSQQWLEGLESGLYAAWILRNVTDEGETEPPLEALEAICRAVRAIMRGLAFETA